MNSPPPPRSVGNSPASHSIPINNPGVLVVLAAPPAIRLLVRDSAPLIRPVSVYGRGVSFFNYAPLIIFSHFIREFSGGNHFENSSSKFLFAESNLVEQGSSRCGGRRKLIIITRISASPNEDEDDVPCVAPSWPKIDNFQSLLEQYYILAFATRSFCSWLRLLSPFLSPCYRIDEHFHLFAPRKASRNAGGSV